MTNATSSPSNGPRQSLLEALLDSWDRNNTILINLLRALPKGGLEARAAEGSPSVARMFKHIRFVRLVLVFENAPRRVETWTSTTTTRSS